MRTALIVTSAVVLLISYPTSANAQISAVEPFEGKLSEGFESFGLTFDVAIDVFSGAAILSGTSGIPAVFVVGSSSLGGGPRVFPHTGSWLGGGGEPVDWIFDTPVFKFGGYFATNSEAADAVADFFDDQDELIASVVVTIDGENQTWVWNGWESIVPVKRIRITGNGINSGFIDYDDMELSFTAPQVPAASGWTMLILTLSLVTVLSVKFGSI